MISQKNAVVKAVVEVLGDDFEAGVTNVREVITPEQKASVREQLLNSFVNGEIVYSKPTDNTSDLKKYVNGLINNHFRKAKELNGGSTYRPASSTGPRGDAQLKELNKLLSSGQFSEGTDQYTSITSAIAERTSTLEAERAAKKAASSKKKIDVSVLPSNIAGLLD